MKPTSKFILWLTFLACLATFGWSWLSGGIVHELLGSHLDAAERVDRLKDYFANLGSAAPFVYVLFVVVEVVVAPIPGLMLYAPGGIIFGPVLGGSLSLFGNMIGAGIACTMTRTLGNSWLTRFFDPDKLDRSQSALASRGAVLIFLLRINPLTSSDIVSYAAGFSRIPIWQVVVATGLGMAPLCYVQAWLAESLMTAYPNLIYPMLAACLIYLVLVVVIVKKMIHPPAGKLNQGEGVALPDMAAIQPDQTALGGEG